MKRTRDVLNDTTVLVTVPRKNNKKAQNVKVVNIEGRSFTKGDDDIFYKIQFISNICGKFMYLNFHFFYKFIIIVSFQEVSLQIYDIYY